MAGNILYILYDVIMILAFIVCVVIIGIKKGTGNRLCLEISNYEYNY